MIIFTVKIHHNSLHHKNLQYFTVSYSAPPSQFFIQFTFSLVTYWWKFIVTKFLPLICIRQKFSFLFSLNTSTKFIEIKCDSNILSYNTIRLIVIEFKILHKYDSKMGMNIKKIIKYICQRELKSADSEWIVAKF